MQGRQKDAKHILRYSLLMEKHKEIWTKGQKWRRDKYREKNRTDREEIKIWANQGTDLAFAAEEDTKPGRHRAASQESDNKRKRQP